MRKSTLFALCAWSCLGTSSVPAADSELTLPFRENFGSSKLDAPWVREVAPQGTLEFRDGGMNFDIPPDGRCHIERPAGVDAITVTGRVSRWGAFYLVWDADNWCYLGKISPTPFGRFSSNVVVAGKDLEVDHRGIDFGMTHWLKVGLGTNYVRFSYSNDGKEWTELRTVERPTGFSGAPKLVAAGRPYTAIEHPFSKEIAKVPSEGGRLTGRITEISVVSTPHEEVTLSKADIEALRKPKVEPVMALLGQDAKDPTFERIVGYYPPMKFPREIVGVPGHPLDIGVDWLGRLDVSPWTPPLAWFEVGEPSRPLGREGVPFKRRLLHGYLPVITLNTDRDGVDYELSVFGASPGFRVDKDLIAYVSISARSSYPGKAPRSVALVWENGKQRRAFPLKSDEDGRSRCFLSFRYPHPDSAAPISGEEFRTKSHEVVAFWEKQLAPAARFDVPDPRVAEALRAWIVYSMLNADTVNGFIEPHDGAGFYEEIFGCSVSLHARALDLYGFHDYATRLLDTQLHFQQSDGLYTQACGLTDPGALLAALARHFAVDNDANWLRRVSPNIVRLCGWLKTQRESAPKSGRVRGLIKFRPYNDYPDPVYNYLGNAWCAQGMAEAGLALKQIGDPEAAAILAEAAAYRTDVLDSMETTSFQDHGMTLLPMEPETHRLLKLSKYRGGDYYGLIASPLLETEFLAPDDKRTQWIVDIMEKRGGLIAGLCEFEGGVDHAYTYGYLMNAMKRDEVRKVLLGFWSMLAFGMTRDTYSPVEVTQITTGENHYTLPHLYSCTEQLRLLRNLLLREDHDTLWLGQGIPRAWLESGKHVAVTSAPSEFGALSYRLEALSDGSIQIRIDPPTRRAPKEIKLRLRAHSGHAIASAEATPATAFAIDGETITFPNLRNSVDLRVRFKGD